MTEKPIFFVSEEALEAIAKGERVSEYTMHIKNEAIDGQPVLLIGFADARPWARVFRALAAIDPELYVMMLRGVESYNADE